MKGYALGFQFNPNSLLSASQFEQFHDLVGTAPVLSIASPADIDAYKVALVDARDILAEAYSFDSGNMGDANGENGW